jgi:hypothetical protein
MSVQGWVVEQVSSATGTVTSVGLALPASVFSVSGSPVTTAGTLTGALITQAANTVFAGPVTGAADVPAFRALVSGDIPDLGGVYAKLAAANNFTNDNIFSSTGYLQLPSGTTAQQPGSPVNGMARFNSTTGRFEFYSGGWRNFVRLDGDTMTGDLTAPNLNVNTAVKLLDTTNKIALDVSAANTLRVGSGFTTVLKESVEANISGTVTTNGTTVVTGSGTSFTTDLAVGDIVTINGSTVYVASITNNTSMSVGNNIASASGVTCNKKNILYKGTSTIGGFRISAYGQLIVTTDANSQFPALASTSSLNTGIGFSGGSVNLISFGSIMVAVRNTGITFNDGLPLGVGTVNGTKIGASTSQKIGFWNTTPIVQPTTAIAAATFVSNTSGTINDSATWDGYTIGQVVKAMRNTGLLA